MSKNERKQSSDVKVQLAVLYERFTIFENMPKQLSDLEKKIDEVTRYLSSEYVRKDELDRILSERKAGFLSTQGIIIGIINIVLAGLVSFVITKL